MLAARVYVTRQLGMLVQSELIVSFFCANIHYLQPPPFRYYHKKVRLPETSASANLITE
jgi:hypothetical protein